MVVYIVGRTKISADSGDTVFCAVGLRSRSEEREALRSVEPDFHALGDCVRPGQNFQALSEAHFIAREL